MQQQNLNGELRHDIQVTLDRSKVNLKDAEGVETKNYGDYIDPTRYEIVYSDTDFHYFKESHKVNGKHESLGVYFDSNADNLPILNK